jgi:hypothetical protein
VTITISDTLIILATLLSPLIAVQVQKWIEFANERRNAKRQIFYDLMATRATRIAPKHVEALNRIDIEFGGSGWMRPTSAEKGVVGKWRIYADHLNSGSENPTPTQLENWGQRGEELFTDLLVALASALNYDFDRVQLKRGIYHPRGHSDQEIRQEVAQRALLDILTGKTALPMKVVEFPFDNEAAELQTKTQKAIIDAFDDGALRVKKE